VRVAGMEEMRNVVKTLIRKLEETFGRPRSRWYDNSRMDLREIGWDLDLFRSGQGAVAYPFEYVNEPLSFVY